VAGVTGPADHITHGQDGAPGGQATPGGFELGQGGGDDDGGGQPVVLPQFSRRQQRAQRGVSWGPGPAPSAFGPLHTSGQRRLAAKTLGLPR
jgi:hypothetical protein